MSFSGEGSPAISTEDLKECLKKQLEFCFSRYCTLQSSYTDKHSLEMSVEKYSSKCRPPIPHVNN